MDGGREVLLAGALTLAAQPQKGCSDGDGFPEQGQACMDVSLFPTPFLTCRLEEKRTFAKGVAVSTDEQPPSSPCHKAQKGFH